MERKKKNMVMIVSEEAAGPKKRMLSVVSKEARIMPTLQRCRRPYQQGNEAMEVQHRFIYIYIYIFLIYKEWNEK